jgi:hypothetical protein
MRGRTCLALVALTAALVSCASSTETPREESAVSPLVLDVMTYAGR